MSRVSVEPFPILSREPRSRSLSRILPRAHFLNVLKRDSVSPISNINVYSDLCTHPPLFAFRHSITVLSSGRITSLLTCLFLFLPFLLRKITDCLRVTYHGKLLSFFLSFSPHFENFSTIHRIHLNLKRAFVKIRDQI